ncbi:MAG: IMP cyclohydrolase [Oscillospiraceae bacterium]|nr:IMP cyclohydrolase [Oscillospiraceae bacterium]
MKTDNLKKLLCENEYPGRGIVVGTTADGAKTAIAYFIMGRSVNSRNRVFVAEGEEMRTKAFDEAKLVDPSLIIYYPVRVVGSTTIVTNGDQTDTIRDGLVLGGSFESALRTRCFEPDAPNYTPRISAMVEAGGNYRMSILKSMDGDPSVCLRQFFDYAPMAGVGHFIHTYACDGNPLPSFAGEPEPVCIEGNIDEFTADVWNSLNEENKVSLFVRFIDRTTGEAETRIVNKNC